jgi:erythritol kinase
MKLKMEIGMKNGPFLLGIDVGTTVTKSVLIDYDGNEICVARCPTAVQNPFPSSSEINMMAVWDAVCQTIQEIIHTHQISADAIKGVGVCSTVAGVWLLNDKKEPFRNAILWNDGRAASILETWEKEGKMQKIFDISANAIFPGMTLPALRWLLEHEAETLKEAKYLIWGKDWVRFKLTGDIHSDESDLSQMPCDVRTRGYSEDLFEICGIRTVRYLFPEVIDSSAIVGGVTTQASKETGLIAGTPVITGLGDVQASMVGAGAIRYGDACSIVGTSSLNNVVMDYACFEPSGVGFMFLLGGNLWIRSLTNTSGTINLEWFLNNFCVEEMAEAKKRKTSVYQVLEEIASSVSIGSEGIIYHPYINTTGVSAPFRNAAARAQFFGIDINHKKKHLLRAVYEGLALAMRELYKSIPAKIKEVIVTGGGARSPFWCQMFADCTGIKMIVPQGEEFGGKGVAIMAGIGIGIYKNLLDSRERTFRPSRMYDPVPENTARYDQVYELYQEIYLSLQDQWWHRHRLLEKLGK